MGADPVQLVPEAVLLARRRLWFSAWFLLQKAGPSRLGVPEQSRPVAPEVDAAASESLVALLLSAALSLGRGRHLP